MPAKIRVHATAVEQVAIADLRGYELNARMHSDEQVAALAENIKALGFTNPLLIDPARVLIAGHGRVEAAKRLGMTAVPCITVKGLTPAQVRALRLADNSIGLRSSWDEDLLRKELEALQAADIDLELAGFDNDELDQLLNPPVTGEVDPDHTPEPPAAVTAMRGDIWLLGGHRLMCGDSTAATDVKALLAAERPHLMVTDPPYGVNYDPDWRNRSAIGWSQSRSTGLVMNDDKADWREAYALFPGDVAYVWHPAGARQVEFYQSLVAAGFEIRMQIIWTKPQFPIGRGNYHVQHEPCWYCVRRGKTAHWEGGRKQTTVWAIDNFSAKGGGKRAGAEDEKTGHGTQKPVECMRRPIENNSKPGQAVYEPFSGSGTTIIAAEMTGRRCLAMELFPAYVDVAVLRWQAFTGQEATLEATGKTYAQTQSDRAGESAVAAS